MNSIIKRTQRDSRLAFKLALIEQVERGELTYTQAQRRYDIQGCSTVLVWLRKYGVLDWHTPYPSLDQRGYLMKPPCPLTPEQRIKDA